MDSSQFPCSHPQDSVAHAEAAANELLSGLRWLHQGGPQKAADNAWTALRCLQSLDVRNVEEPDRGAILELKEKVLEATRRKGIKTWDARIIALSLKKFRKKLGIRHQRPAKAEPKLASEVAPQPRLAATFERAYQSFQFAASEMGKVPTDKQAHDWLKAHGPSEYELPDFATWCRYVRAGRKFYGDNKNSPRAGRTGRSIVKAKDV